MPKKHKDHLDECGSVITGGNWITMRRLTEQQKTDRNEEPERKQLNLLKQISRQPTD